MRTVSRLIIAAPLVLALSACLGISGGGKVPASLFSLTPTSPAPVGVELNGKLDDAIMVLDPETDRRLAVVRVAVQVDDSNVAYLTDAQWVEHPAHLFGSLLAETIRARGKRLVLGGEDGLGSVRTRLGGRLIDMGFDARSQSAVVRFEAIRVSAGGTTVSKRFEAVVPVTSAKSAVVGPALNRAANDVAGQVADWVG